MQYSRYLQTGWDGIGMPFRLILFDQKWLPYFHWTTLEEQRIQAVLPHIREKLLDIGAGPNNLVTRYGNGIGVDVYDWGGGAIVVEKTSQLPFDDQSFDTVSFIACLNHIPYRKEVIREAYRVLRPGGRVIVTMINPILGGIGHALWWYSEDKHRGGMTAGEVGGMWNHDIQELFEEKKFIFEKRIKFGDLWLNNLLLFKKSL